MEARDLATEEAQPLLETLARAGIPAPEVGHEILAPQGTVSGMAELAWPDRALAILDASQETFADAFRAAGWETLSLEAVLEAPDALVARFSGS